MLVCGRREVEAEDEGRTVSNSRTSFVRGFLFKVANGHLPILDYPSMPRTYLLSGYLSKK